MARRFEGTVLRIGSKRTVLLPIEAAAREWEARTGARVEAVNIPITEREARYERMAAEGDGTFDLLDAYDPLVPRYGARLYEDLEALGLETADFLASALTPMRTEGRLCGLPLHAEFELFIYNREHFAAAGIDPETTEWTWSNLYGLGSRLRTAHRYPSVAPWLAPGGEGYLYWLCYYNSTGQALLSDDRTEVRFDNDDALATWQAVEEGFRRGFFDPVAAAELPREWPYSADHEAALYFNRGDASSQIGVVELWGQAVSGDPAFEVRILPEDVGVTILPGLRPGTSGSVSCAEGLGINRYGRNREAALSFLQFVTGDAFQRRMMLGEFGFVLPSSRRTVLGDPEIRARFPLAEVLERQSGFPAEHYSAPYDYQDVIESALRRLFWGEWTAEQAHEETLAGVTRLVREYAAHRA